MVAARRKRGAEPLTFAMTFPFSTHNYQLRFWMAVGGVDPDEDVRMVVLPPPFMADSLASGQVDAFCVGAPWNSIAVDRGVGHILHFVSDILVRAAEKVLAVRQSWSEQNADVVAALVRATARGSTFVEENREETARILARPERVGVDADIIRRTLDGHLKIFLDGTMRQSGRYLLVGREDAARPDPVQAAWLYAQMARWGRPARQGRAPVPRWRSSGPVSTTPRSASALARLRLRPMPSPAFAGPAFNPEDITGYLAWFSVAKRV